LRHPLTKIIFNEFSANVIIIKRHLNEVRDKIGANKKERKALRFCSDVNEDTNCSKVPEICVCVSERY
jgi:hypothetical protein